MRFPRAVLAPRVALMIAALALLVALSSCAQPTLPDPAPDWLWVSVWGESKLLAFDPEQIETGATGVQAALAIGLGADRRPYGFDFDGGGNLWVGTQAGELLMYAADDVSRSGTPEPAAELTTGTLHVSGVRFAPDGSLWATVQGKLLGWSPATLSTGGAPAPDVTLTSASPAMSIYPNDLAFDPNGGVWLTGTDALVRFSGEQLAVGGEVEPDVIIGSDGASLASPRGLAFDANGDLWVSNITGSTVEKFRRQDLLASGTPTPVVTLQPPGITKMRVAFDGDDNLWVSATYDPSFSLSGYVAMVSPPNRVTSGVTVASVEFSELGPFDAVGAMVFHPGPR